MRPPWVSPVNQQGAWINCPAQDCDLILQLQRSTHSVQVHWMRVTAVKLSGSSPL